MDSQEGARPAKKLGPGIPLGYWRPGPTTGGPVEKGAIGTGRGAFPGGNFGKAPWEGVGVPLGPQRGNGTFPGIALWPGRRGPQGSHRRNLLGGLWGFGAQEGEPGAEIPFGRALNLFHLALLNGRAVKGRPGRPGEYWTVTLSIPLGCGAANGALGENWIPGVRRRVWQGPVTPPNFGEAGFGEPPRGLWGSGFGPRWGGPVGPWAGVPGPVGPQGGLLPAGGW